jgi:hypothetical protein
MVYIDKDGAAALPYGRRRLVLVEQRGLGWVTSTVIIQMFGAPDPEADTTEQSADTRADTTKYKRRAHKHARYKARYARYRNFEY